jgi:hypothetical protein
MQSSTSDFQSLVARLEKLEQQYQWLKSEVATEKLDLVDVAGKTRATLRMSAGVPSFILYDTNENVRAVLRVSEEGPSLHLLDSETKVGLELRVSEAGPDVSLFDANGKQRLTLQVTRFESGTPYLAMHNANAAHSVVVTTLDNGPSIALVDPANPDGNTSVRLQVDNEGPSLLCIKDGNILWSAP